MALSEREDRARPAPNGEQAVAVERAGLLGRERALARLARLYAALSQVSQAIICTPRRDELFQKVCRALVEQGGFRMVWIGWHDAATSRLVPVASSGDEAGYLQGIQVHTDQRLGGCGPSGTAFREQRPMVSNDLHEDPVTRPWRAELERQGFLATAAFPIRENDEVGGVLSIYANEAGYFEAKEFTLLAEAAADISFALNGLTREDTRLEAERTLRQERDFSNAVLNSLSGVFYLYDQRNRFLRWNRNFEKVTGYTPAEIANMTPLEFFPEVDRALVATRIEEVFEQGESNVEAGFLAKDGSVTPYHFTGVMSELDGRPCLVGVGIDISKRRRAEAAMRASEARYRALFEHAPDGLLIADADSCYLDANPSICRMLGYTREELVGRHAADIVAPAEVEHIAHALSSIKAEAGYEREWQFSRKDGSVFSAEVIGTLMPDGNVLGMVRDITERKRAERALRELNETLELKVAARTEEVRAALVRAEAADQLKSAFLATMSHELRTPLNSIIGFTSIILQGMAGPLEPEQSKQLGMVLSSARHLLELINDVLDLSKIEAQQLEVHAEAFDLAASVERVIASIKPLAEQKGLSIAAVMPPGLSQMVSDRRRVEQILLNLLNNALKFTVRGGVTLTVEVVGDQVRLRVVDTGVGIKPEDLATLFQPFRQLDSGLARGHEGSGLGLAICRRLAALLGGEISVTSEWAVGSEFSVTLPLWKPPAP